MTTDSGDSHLSPAMLLEGDSYKVREHLADCARCRARAAETRPEMLFTLLAAERPADQEWQQALKSVSLAVRSSTSTQPGAQSASRQYRPVAWLAVAAALLLAIIFGTRGTGPVPSAAGPGKDPLVTVGMPTAGMSSHIEWISTPRAEATRYDFVVGSAQVVMIFDQGLDL